MIRLIPHDLIAVRANDKYYYALILDKIRLFGGNWTYALHRTSSELLPTGELFVAGQPGFHAFIDFIWAKREGCIERLAKIGSVEAYNFARCLKATNTFKGKADLWFIYDLEFNLLKRTTKLSEEERRYPLHERIDATIMVERIEQGWTPEADARL